MRVGPLYVTSALINRDTIVLVSLPVEENEKAIAGEPERENYSGFLTELPASQMQEYPFPVVEAFQSMVFCYGSLGQLRYFKGDLACLSAEGCDGLWQKALSSRWNADGQPFY